MGFPSENSTNQNCQLMTAAAEYASCFKYYFIIKTANLVFFFYQLDLKSNIVLGYKIEKFECQKERNRLALKCASDI